MQKRTFSPRHRDLIVLKDNIDLLKLGLRDKEYRKYIDDVRVKVVQEIRKEQSKSGTLPPETIPQGRYVQS